MLKIIQLIVLLLYTKLSKQQGEISTDVTLTRYYLWTRQNQNIEQELIFGNLSNIQESNFDGSKKTKVFVHGYTGNGKQGWIINGKDLHLGKEDCNVISVDWNKLAGPAPWYGVAVNNAKNVGARTGDLLLFMMENFGLSASDVHVIGWSLGGQLVAFIGQQTNGQLARITGLDPAGFLWHTAPPEGKLSPGDAQFVDVIHSAGLWIGTDEKVGDVDFYPNGGEAHQPGCEDEDAFGIDCSHARAPDFYIESITSDIGFLAWQCDNFQDFMAGFCYGRETNYMGEPANSAKPGIYFLQTNAQKPFAMPPTQN